MFFTFCLLSFIVGLICGFACALLLTASPKTHESKVVRGKEGVGGEAID